MRQLRFMQHPQGDRALLLELGHPSSGQHGLRGQARNDKERGALPRKKKTVMPDLRSLPRT